MIIMKKTIIAANWKMNKTKDEAVSFIKKFKSLIRDIKDKEIIICPSFTALCIVSKEIKDSNIKLGAQNLYCEKEGAFTGEISPLMLKDLHCEYVIIGHSERRHIFNEPDELINKKLKTAIANNIIPIFCVGETLEQRKTGKTKDIIRRQIEKGLKGINGKLLIAYEPVWAIGTGLNATPEQAEEVHSLIKKFKETPILYGGSVNPDNINDLIKMPNIDGVLVGGASLDPVKFARIVRC